MRWPLSFMAQDMNQWHFSDTSQLHKYNMYAGHLRLHTLLMIRWIALLGQLITLLTIEFVLNLTFPFWYAVGIISLSALVNCLASLQRSGKTRLHENEATIFLGFDLLQLTCLVYVTGGIENPFLILILAPVTISASLLSLRSVIILSLMAIFAVSIVDYDHFPLPFGIENSENFFLQHAYYRIGIWAALMIAIIFIAAYNYSMACESRRMVNALSETQMALAREQKLSDIGMISAALAHELGTPLGTIAVLNREIQRDLDAEHPLQEDLHIMRQQIDRCRSILSQMSHNPQTEQTPYVPLTTQALVNTSARNHKKPHIDLQIKTFSKSDSDALLLFPHRPDIIYGLGALIQNAFQYAANTIMIQTYRAGPHVILLLSDDGPGFAPEVLHDLGEPYLSGRQMQGNHMGLGVFIAKILLERSQAHLEFYNHTLAPADIPAHIKLCTLPGAHIKITWHQDHLQTSFSSSHSK